MKTYKTIQERYWSGEFGDKYSDRNIEPRLVASNIALFSKIFNSLYTQIQTVIEFGAGYGNNMLAIRSLLPNVHLTAVEINSKAVKKLHKIKNIDIYHKSIIDIRLTKKYDFVFTKGVLIHINPEELDNVYDLLYKASNKFICLAEYYNPTPVEVKYRGHNNLLYKRDFAGDMLKKYKNLRLVNYGFSYRGEINFYNADITWFLLSK